MGEMWGRGFATDTATAVVSRTLEDMPAETIVARVTGKGSGMKLRQRRGLLVTIVCAAAVIAGLVLVVDLVNPAKNVTVAAPWAQAPRVHGRTVRLTYASGECHQAASVQVASDAHRVVLTVEDVSAADACDLEGVQRTVAVRLPAPLGERALVDGACLVSENAGRSYCSAEYRHSALYLRARTS